MEERRFRGGEVWRRGGLEERRFRGEEGHMEIFLLVDHSLTWESAKLSRLVKNVMKKKCYCMQDSTTVSEAVWKCILHTTLNQTVN